MCNKGPYVLEHMVFKRSNSGIRECLAYHTSFTRMCYFIDCALRIVSRGGSLEGPICRGLLYIRSTSVDIWSRNTSDILRKAEKTVNLVLGIAVWVLNITLFGPYRTHGPNIRAHHQLINLFNLYYNNSI